MRRYLPALLFFSGLFLSFPLLAQQGKEGARTVTAANTIVNEYTNLTADAGAGDQFIMVGNSGLNGNGRFTAALSEGDLVMIIQMQGASIKQNAPGDVVGDTSFGEVLSYNNCGLYEFQQVADVPNGTTIVFDCVLKNSYTASGRVQIVRVPRYDSLIVNNGGILTCDAWNGTVGGILAVEVKGNMIVNTGGSIDATGKGFRGGNYDNNDAVFGGQRWTTGVNTEGAEKGEGIGGYVTDYDGMGGRYCRAPGANGGGGGNAHNCGGGGGANAGNISLWNGKGNPDNTMGGWTTAWNLEGNNFSASTSSGGGRGGYSFSNSNQNATTLGPTNGSWGGDGRANRGGWGARPLDYSTGRLFLGGGGGAGDQNYTGSGSALGYAGAGGAGGGMIYTMVYGNISGTGQVIARGNNGQSTRTAGKDGAGGGGGGGTIILNAIGSVTGITSNADGGAGGNVTLTPNGNDAYGPGGGGGGGYIAASGGAITQSAAGGANGTTNSNGLLEFPPNGATRGGAGQPNETITNFYLTAQDDTICQGQSTVITVTLNGTVPGGTTIIWYDSLTGGTQLNTGANFTTPILTSTQTYYAGTCPGTYRIPVTITVLSSSSINAGPDTAICPGQSVTLTSSGGITYSWSPGGTLSDSTIAGPVATPTSTTSYIVTVTNSLGCSSKDTAVITVRTPPAADAGNDTTICSGTSVTLNGSGGTIYAWSPNATLDDSTKANPVASPADTTTYTVWVRDAFGCTALDSVTVNVAPLPNVDAGADTAFCAGDSVQLNASGASAYSWTPSAGLSATNISNPYAKPSGNQVYYVTGTNTAGCSRTDSVTVNVNPLPAADAGADATICPGGTAQLSGSGGISCSWSPATSLSNPSLCNPTANPSSDITYILTVTSAAGCTGTDSMSVTLGSALTVNAGADTSVCPGGSVQLMVTGAVGQTYAWSPSAGLDDSTKVNPVATPAGTVTYSVLVTDSSGCSGSDSVTVTVRTPPVAIAGNDTSICPGTTAGLTASGGTGYAWSPKATLNDSTIANPVAAPLGNTTYTVIVRDNFGCTAIDSVVVSLLTPPAVNAGTDTAICAGDTVQLNASGAGSYSWSPSAGLSNTSVSNPLAFPSAGTPYTVTVTGSNGCTNTDTVYVAVHALPAANAGPDVTFCTGGSAQLNGSGGVSCTWSPAAGLSSTTSCNPTASPSSNTTYVLTVTDNNGCRDEDSVTVGIGTSLSVNAGSDTTICPGTGITLNVTGAVGTMYLWTPSTGLDDPTRQNPVASPSSTTTYVVTVTDGTGCQGKDTVTVFMGPGLAVTAGPDTAICLGKSVTLSASAGAFYQWTPSTGLSSATVQQPVATPAATTTYIVTVTASNGCKGSDTVTVTINSNPGAFALPADTTVKKGTTVQLTAGGGTGCAWLPAPGLTDTTACNPAVTPSQTTTYYVYVTDASGCPGIDSVIIRVEDKADLFIPNAFSPNGDSYNDLFRIRGNGISKLKLVVYDRWGEKVFEADDINDTWDGTFRGLPLNPAVFMYYFEAEMTTGEKVVQEGNITLIR